MSEWKLLICVQLFATPWTCISMEFSRPDYWNGQPFPSPGDLPNPGIEPPTLQVDSLPAEPQGKPKNTGVGNLSLLQQIFPTQELNQGLLHHRWILYQLSYEGRVCVTWEIQLSISSVQSLSHVQLCDPMDCNTSGLPVHYQLPELTQTQVHESVMPSSHLILCHPLLLLPSIFPASGSFPMSQFFTSGGQIIGVSASASVLPMNIQGWIPLGWTG